MLTPEEARIRLESLRNDAWRQEAEERIRQAPKATRPALQTIIKDIPSYLRRQNPHRQEFHTAAQTIDALSAKDRTRAFAALHPGLGPLLSDWYLAAVSMPYQRGWYRRAFRAPTAPRVSQFERVDALAGLMAALGPYPADAEWLAAWAQHLSIDREAGPALGVAIDRGGAEGEAVFQALVAAGNGEHPISMMGRHVIGGLLGCSRREGWEYVGRMLVAAQRQEGLRQVILECVDEANYHAFQHMIRVILDEKLLRFSAVLRAAGVWTGWSLDVENQAEAAEIVALLGEYLGDRERAYDACQSNDPRQVYLSLMASAMCDAVKTVPQVEWCLGRDDPEVRVAAALMARQIGTTTSDRVLQRCVYDQDVRVAWIGFERVSALLNSGLPLEVDVFDALWHLAGRVPAKPTQIAAGVAGVVLTVQSGLVLKAAINSRQNRPLDVFIPWLPRMDVGVRTHFARQIAVQTSLSPELYAVAFDLLSDRSGGVRDVAIKALAKHQVADEDLTKVEGMLTRNATDLRRGLLGLLASMPVPGAAESARRLWACENQNQKNAGCELVVLLSARDEAAASTLAAEFLAEGASAAQREWLEPLSQDGEKAGPLDGFYDPDSRTRFQQPTMPDGDTFHITEAAARIVSELDDLVHEYRDTTVVASNWQGSQQILLGDVRWLVDPLIRRVAGTEEGSVHGMILPEVFRPWWESRGPELRDSDGQEALRALAALLAMPIAHAAPAVLRNPPQRSAWHQHALDISMGTRPVGLVRYWGPVSHVLAWFAHETASELSAEVSVAGAEAFLSTLKPEYFVERNAREVLLRSPWVKLAGDLHCARPSLFDSARLARLASLRQWIAQPTPEATLVGVEPTLLLQAHAAGAINDHDLICQLLESRGRWGLLNRLTRRRRSADERDFPKAVRLADELRRRVVEREVMRGDLPTQLTRLAPSIASTEGADLALRLLASLGKASLVRGYVWREDRQSVLSHLVRVNYPAADDGPEVLAAAAKTHGISEARLVELGVYAPQWATLVEQALGWPGFAESVWWIHAHTKDTQWRLERELVEEWAAMCSERTALTSDELTEGAVDVDWFWRCYQALGEERWAKVYKAGRLASGGSGHRRAQIFGDALLGRIEPETLVGQIRDKRNQDSVRALGLLPLPADEGERSDLLLARFSVLQEFKRGSSSFGQMRQQNEKLAVRIAMSNLARNAGYSDPQRYIWAMETAEITDLASGPITAEEDGVSVSLSIDGEGQAHVTVTRGDKQLKAVPTSLRKREAIAALTKRKATLRRQASRVRRSLEESMIRGDRFVAQELADLEAHPLIKPMLQLLVFADEVGTLVRLRDGERLDVGGTPTNSAGDIRIAHPVDFLASGSWSKWQRALYTEGVRQPFKQVFRELYVPTRHEIENGPTSGRYEGHQLQPRVAQALLASRGWFGDREAGFWSRSFHEYGLVARMDVLGGFMGMFSPLDVELPTLNCVWFTRRGEMLALPLDTVPPIVFSEAMRDLDLVVATAHAGAVDPEASASTVEMRIALAEEALKAMRLDNVRFDGLHAVIEGKIGEYSLHMGSGVVHRRPGGQIFIVPIHAQHRGRIFLPFADDDPKTAEVMSKLLLFARDDQIKDPTILEQMRAV